MFETAFSGRSLLDECGGTLSTHGLGEAMSGTLRQHTEPFCVGKCAARDATHKINGPGKAKLLREVTEDQNCPECLSAVFWSNKYKSLRPIPKEE